MTKTTNTSYDTIIETRDLRKTFPPKGRSKSSVEAVRGINFEVKKGEIFGLLGPNGAGKTTTMRMLCTLLLPTSGEVKIAGFSLNDGQEEIRKKIGYVSQVGGMQREATGRENILLQAKLYGMDKDQAEKRVDEVMSFLKIGDFSDRKTVTYSGGQRRIFDLATGIVHRPELLFLDEPSTGLDPQNRAHVWEQVKELQKQGTTIFVTTHYLEEADALCSRVAIVDKGLVVAIGTPSELKQQVSGDHIELGFENDKSADEAEKALPEMTFIRDIYRNKNVLHIHVDKGEENLPEVLHFLHGKNIKSKTIALSRPTLDDVFLKLTGRTLRDSENGA